MRMREDGCPLTETEAAKADLPMLRKVMEWVVTQNEIKEASPAGYLLSEWNQGAWYRAPEDTVTHLKVYLDGQKKLLSYDSDYLPPDTRAEMEARIEELEQSNPPMCGAAFCMAGEIVNLSSEYQIVKFHTGPMAGYSPVNTAGRAVSWETAANRALNIPTQMVRVGDNIIDMYAADNSVETLQSAVETIFEMAGDKY